MTIIRLTNAEAQARAGALNAVEYADPATREEIIAFSNANAYEWSYYDTCRENGVTPITVPPRWAIAWLEYTRRNPSRMAIREGFRQWRDHGTLPGLS